MYLGLGFFIFLYSLDIKYSLERFNSLKFSCKFVIKFMYLVLILLECFLLYVFVFRYRLLDINFFLGS